MAACGLVIYRPWTACARVLLEDSLAVTYVPDFVCNKEPVQDTSARARHCRFAGLYKVVVVHIHVRLPCDCATQSHGANFSTTFMMALSLVSPWESARQERSRSSTPTQLEHPAAVVSYYRGAQ